MRLAQRSVGQRLGILGGWRSQFDFDAPGLAIRDRLTRLEYAATQAARQCVDDAALAELEFILSECHQMLEMEELGGEAAAEARVPQRMERIRRVVLHYEGGISSLNRRFWWIPCTVGLLVMICCFAQYVMTL